MYWKQPQRGCRLVSPAALTLELPLLLLVIITSSGHGVRTFHLLVLLSQSIFAQLLLRQELTFAPCVNHNIAYFAALALLLGATLLNLLRILSDPSITGSDVTD